MKEKLEDIIIRDIMVETSGEIDLSVYRDLIRESIWYYLEKEYKIK